MRAACFVGAQRDFFGQLLVGAVSKQQIVFVHKHLPKRTNVNR